MQYTTLGKTALRVSVAGLGTGGFSRMGLKSGKSEEEAARLILDAADLGINFRIDWECKIFIVADEDHERPIASTARPAL